MRAVDAEGPGEPATQSFTVDITAPETAIDEGPAGTTSDATPSFTVSSSESGSTFACEIDGAAVSCSDVGALADGPHTFAVRATDAAGNQDGSPATRDFTVDASAPDTAIASGPEGATRATSFTFAFSSDDPAATFECTLDGRRVLPCDGTYDTPELRDGPHAFTVRAVDAGGNADPSPATRSFTVDTAAPRVLIGGSNAGAVGSPIRSFAFSSEAGASLECWIDDEAPSACTSPFSRSLPDGPHRFSVRATDAAGNVGPPETSPEFTVDTIAPETSIVTGPPSVTDAPTPAFTFVADEAGSTFRCRIDGGPEVACGSPYTSDRLGDGPHTFGVRATDAAGNRDASEATHVFAIDTSTPDTVIDSGPSGATASSSAAFAFSSPDGGTSFECRLDGGAWEACSSPRAYTTLPDGAHSFEVRTRNAVGTFDPIPAARTFTVGTASVSVLASPAPLPAGPPTPAVAALAGDRTGPRVVISSRNKSIFASSRGLVLFRVGPVREPVSGVVRLKTSGKVLTGARGRRSVLALGGRFLQAASGKQAMVRIQLTRSSLAVLRRNRRMKVQATVTLRDAAGNSTTLTYRFTLRAPRPR